MKKIYVAMGILLTILIITSTYSAAAGLDLNIDNSEPSIKTGSDDGGLSNSNNNVNHYADIYLSSDKLFIAEIDSVTPNPTYVNSITVFKGWVKDSKNLNVSFEWDFGDGKIFNDNGSGQPFLCDTKHIYSAPGKYIVTLSLIKEDQILDIDTIEVTVLDSLFKADAGGPYLGLVGNVIWFDASSTSINGNDSYEWESRDRVPKSGKRIPRRYSNAGIYNVALTVTDDNGNTAIDSTTITIAKISLSIDQSNAVANDKIGFGAEVLGFTPASFVWDFGDDYYSSGQYAIHEYSESGKYYGNLKVYDEKGNYLKSDFTIIVGTYKNQQNQNPASIFSVSSYSGDTSTIFKFDALQSFDRDGEIALYKWYFGDGGMILTRNEKCNYIFTEEGEWDVTCIAIDTDGGFDSSIKEVEVTDADGVDFGSDPDSASGLKDSLDDQDGVVYSFGSMKEVENKPTIKEIPDIESVDFGAMCDLDISVSGISDLPEFGEPVKIQVAVNDLLGNYDAKSVNIKLLSNIPGYESFDYVAQKDMDTELYIVDIDISSWPEDTKEYTITFTANPLEGYTEKDWSGNIWSEKISAKSIDLPRNLNFRDFNFGSFAL